MKSVTATTVRAGHCSICGARKQSDETWFLITENHWEDRLDIWRWHRPLALEASVHSLCSPRHVRELVVHWMTTGCLAYPFALAPERLAPAKGGTASAATPAPSRRPMVQHLGELSVDRIGILRALRENPLSLNIILDELMLALEQESQGDGDSGFEHAPYFALRGM
jgi:hypothetical protein